MPDAPLTTDQQSLQDVLSQYNFYLNPANYTGSNDPTQHYSAGTPATNLLGQTGGAGQLSNATLDIGTALLGGGPFLSRLFGRKAEAPQFQPYVDSNGNYVWTPPQNANPVPLSNIPGVSAAPTAEYTSLANNIRAISDLLPYLSSSISAQKIPDALGQLAADTAVTGPRLALQQQLQEQYGPIFDRLNAESQLRNAMSSTSNDAAVLAGPGQQLLDQAKQAAMAYDPEYFATRAKESDSIGKLLEQTTNNLGSGLSPTERDEIDRGLALSNSRAGTANAPSNLNTISNAIQFGNAGRARETQNQNQLSQAIAASTAFLPQSRSGVDVFQVATGKPSTNTDSRFNTSSASDANANANALLNSGNSLWTTNANNAAQSQLQKDAQSYNSGNWMNQLGSITSALGSVGSLAAGI